MSLLLRTRADRCAVFALAMHFVACNSWLHSGLQQLGRCLQSLSVMTDNLCRLSTDSGRTILLTGYSVGRMYSWYDVCWCRC